MTAPPGHGITPEQVAAWKESVRRRNAERVANSLVGWALGSEFDDSDETEEE